MEPISILMVDDEKLVRNALERALRTEGYRLRFGASAEEGLQQMMLEPADIVISDQRMPGMGGVDFLNEVRIQWPQTLRILLTGYADMQTAIRAINEGAVWRFLTKPWNDNEFKVLLALAAVEVEEAREADRIFRRVTQKGKLMEAVLSRFGGLFVDPSDRKGEEDLLEFRAPRT